MRRRLKKLLEDEAQFRAIFENTAIGIVLADAEGRARECNPAVGQMFGYTEDELRKMRISDFTPGRRRGDRTRPAGTPRGQARACPHRDALHP